MPRHIIARSLVLRCDGCGKEFSACLTEDEGWKAKCPACAVECSSPPGHQGANPKVNVHKGNFNFYGQRRFSLASGCHPSEVPLYKKIMGPKFESCILDDGTVKFKNAKQQAAFAEHFEVQRLRNRMDPGMFDRGRDRPEDLR